MRPNTTALFDLTDRTAIVTGASSGLGLRFTTVLANSGARVFAAARRAERLDALAAEYPNVCPVPCDVRLAEQRAALVDQASAQSGGIDVLVNNAGLAGEQRIEDESPADVESVLGVNLIAALEICRLVGARAADTGTSIINVASVLGLVAGFPLGGAAYAASKGGLIALTRELAAQWGQRGIRVNALAPGWFHTEMTAELFQDKRATRYVDQNSLLRRAGRVDELDGALLFLASQASTYVTGQVITVDGGWTAR
jgi:NAD(P)-dependent dehydrogenase (short-subunit alcohol dehydrogenase family)